MGLYGMRDLLLSDTGDLVLSEDEVVEVTSDADIINQLVTVAVRSTNPEWLMESFPADMEDLIGLENSRETAELGKRKIRTALVEVGFEDDENIWIEAKPISPSEILFFIFLNIEGKERMVFEVGVNLEYGMSVRRVNIV